MTERPLTSEERAEVERMAGIAEPYIAAHNNGENTARLETVRAAHYAAIAALMRERGDLKADVRFERGRYNEATKELAEHMTALADTRAALARLTEALRHQVQRNHPFNARACSGCFEAQRALASGPTTDGEKGR